MTHYYSEAYFEDGNITVLKGSKINTNSNSTVPLGSKLEGLRVDKNLVDDNGCLLSDCKFESPTTAAKFVTGGSRDGYDTWKVEKGKTLGKYLEEHGLRYRKVKNK